MKKKISFVLVSLFMMLNILNVNASTNTFQRTEDNLLVPDYIEVTDYRKTAIMSTPAVDASEKIYDFADLFTNDEEEKLYTDIKDYMKNYDYDLAVVTINENNKGTARDYAQDFYDYNSFGKNSTHDGVVFIIDMDTREVYMATTGDAMNMYNDNRIEKTMDQVYSYMTNKDYYTGTHKFINIIKSYAKLGKPTGSESNYKIDSNGKVSKTLPWLVIIIIPSVVTLIVMLILVFQNKLVRKATTAREYLNQSSVNIQTLRDSLVSTHTTRTKIEHSNNSSGGSSSFSGSSGISHGGGGHGF